MNQPKSLPKSIWALGVVSLFMDISSETVHGLLPVFLVSVMGASYTAVGLIEGIGEAAALAIKMISGPLSDWLGKRKPLVLLGYGMGAFSKPLFALASSAGFIFGARLFDRVGKGIRGAPRDALVADLAPEELRGRAFGLRQSLDTVGAFLGPLLAILLMSLTNGDYRLVFWLATIPGLIAVMVIIFGVKEPEPGVSQERKRLSLSEVRGFGKPFWAVTIAGAVFQLARFSEAFLILRAENLGLSLAFTPLVLVLMNIVYSISAYPIGWLSDRLHREGLALTGFFLLALADLFLALGDNLVLVFIGIGLWGLHLGFTQGILAALVADTCPPAFRGTAYGIFNLFSAVALLLASATAGLAWDRVGPALTFLLSAGFSLVGFILLAGFWKEWPAPTSGKKAMPLGQGEPPRE